MRVNAMTEKFEDVTVLGHPMLFTCARVDRATVPEGLYILNGLASNYPELISVSFAIDLDNIYLKDDKTSADVLALF